MATMSRSPLKEELIVQLRRTIPVSLSHLMRRSLDVMSVAVLGHIGKDVLAAGALAQSTVNTVALSVLVGLSSATVTLTSQAVGAGDRLQTGLWLHRAIVVSFLTALPITVLLSFLAPILKAVGQKPELADIAGGYCAWLLPGIWAWAITWAVNPWLQAHGIVKPSMYCAIIVACIHPFLLALLVYGLSFGPHGAAMAGSLSLINNAALLTLYTRKFLKSSVPLIEPSRASFQRLGTFLHLGLPGVLTMQEWWASELAILIAGRLPRAAMALASMACYQLINAVCFMVPLGCSVAGATRVGAALGANRPIDARRAAKVCVGLGISIACTCSLVLLCARHLAAAVFTTDGEVKAILRDELLPRLCLYIIADASQICCSGVLQGCGRQREGAPWVIVAYYLIGLPTACVLAFSAKQGAAGMVSGMLIGKCSHALAFGWLTARTDWEVAAANAARRVKEEAAAAAAGATPSGEMSKAEEEVEEANVSQKKKAKASKKYGRLEEEGEVGMVY